MRLLPIVQRIGKEAKVCLAGFFPHRFASSEAIWGDLVHDIRDIIPSIQHRENQSTSPQVKVKLVVPRKMSTSVEGYLTLNRGRSTLLVWIFSQGR